jgi:pseudouridine-5'-monophosphatase
LHLHHIPIAIATGSRRRNLELKTSKKQELMKCFDGHIACADDGVIEKGRGKPNPDIYLYAAKHLLNRPVGGIRQEEMDLVDAERQERAKGLVFEDAIPGMQAGKRAGMNGELGCETWRKLSNLFVVVWVPDRQLLDVEYNGVEKADQTLKSLEDFVPEQWGLPPYERA